MSPPLPVSEPATVTDTKWYIFAVGHINRSLEGLTWPTSPMLNQSRVQRIRFRSASLVRAGGKLHPVDLSQEAWDEFMDDRSLVIR